MPNQINFRSSSTMFFVKATSTASTVSFGFVVARLLGAASAGLMAQALSICILFATLATVGLNKVVLRRIPRYLQERCPGPIAEEMTLMFLICLATSVTLMGCGIAMLFAFSETLEMQSVTRDVFALHLVLVPPFTIGLLLGGTINALDEPAWGTVLENSVGFLLASVGIAAVAVFAPNFVTVVNASVVLVMAMVVNVGLSLVVWYRKSRQYGIPVAAAPTVSLEILKLGRSFLVIGAMLSILAATDILMVGWLIGDAASGVYSVAVKLSTVMTFVSVALAPIFNVTFTKNYASGSFSEMSKTAQLVGVLGGCVSLFLLIFYAFAGRWILSLYGDEFVSAFNCLIILSVGYFFVTAIGPAPAILYMTNAEAAARRIATSVVVLNLVLSPLLIMVMGIEGAASATALSLVISKLAAAAVVFRRFGIITVPFVSALQRGS